MGVDPVFGWIVAGSLLGVALAEFLVWTGRRPTNAAVAAWAGRHGLALDEQTTGAAVRRQLRRGRLARTLGFLTVFAIGEGASLYWTHIHPPTLLPEPPLPVPFSVLASPSGWAAGYLAGALVAELTRPRPDPGRLHAAALTPRTLGGYLSAGMLAAERLVAVAVVALVPLALRWAPAGWSWTFLDPRGRAGIADGVVAVVIAALVEVGLRMIVRRAQPVASTAALGIDNALRSTTVHRVAAAGLAVQFFLLSEQGPAAFSRMGWSYRLDWLSVAAFWLGVGCVALAIGAWTDRGTLSWWPLPGPTGRERSRR